MYKRLVPKFEDAISALSTAGFEIASASGIPGRFVKKYGCGAGIDVESATGHTRVTAKPGYILAGEIGRLIDRGYQKFLKTSKLEVPATAEHLRAIHQFSEELKEVAGLTSLYNESLGTVSDRYVYDRVKDRDPGGRHPRPWDTQN